MNYLIQFVLILFTGVGFGGFQQIPSSVIASSILSDFTERNPKASNLTVLLDAPISDQHDLLVVCGTEFRQPYRSRPDRIGLLPTDLFGVYLKERDKSQPRRLFLEAAGGGGVDLQVAHVSSSEVVFWRELDGRRLKTLKLFWDPEAVKVVARVDYEPFFVTRIIDEAGIPRFVAGDMKQILIVRPSGVAHEFAIETATEARDLLQSLDYYTWTTPGQSFRMVQRLRHPVRRFGSSGQFLLKEEPSNGGKYDRITEHSPEGIRTFVLPQSTWDEFEQSRPERVRDGYKRSDTTITIEEEIGPNQVVGNRLWFGKSFYDAEGITGVGGFGILIVPPDGS